MPICPRCNYTIHREAKEQCPVCGYNLLQQDKVFGQQEVTFPRVLDHAGVLLQQERNALLGFLADLERNIPPVALCIYLTNRGQSSEFRSHAHWILNRARIHTPSFGKREGQRAIEDAELRELKPGDTPRHEHEDEPRENILTRGWKRLGRIFRDSFTPCPPPVRHEWMLILVVDVQLKMACFSWGYMLDPYINPDQINSCITAARLQFRERATVAALELVMKKAVRQIAASARRVNRSIGKGGHIAPPLLAGMLGLALLAAPAAEAAPAKTPAKTTARAAAKPAAKPAKKAVSKPAPPSKPKTAKPAAAKPKPATAKAPAKTEPPKVPATPLPVMQDDAVAEEVEETPPAPAPEPVPVPSQEPAPAPVPEQAAATPPDTGAAASLIAAPRWNKDDYKNLMEGKLGTAYNHLLPQGKVAAPPAKTPQRAKSDESDTTVPGRYCPEYKTPARSGLNDPQGLLSDIERTDVEHVLREFNAHSPFRIYAAVFKAGQSIPQELNAGTLATAIAMPCEYAAVILYSTGDTPEVQLGYQEITLNDEQQRERLLQVRQAATQAGGGVNGLIAAIRCLHGSIAPMAGSFHPIKPESQVNVPLINIELKNLQQEKGKSFRDKAREWAQTPAAISLLIELGIGAALLLPFVLYFVLHRRVVRLIATTPDVRLSSPHGAGVSRYVRYLDGKEAAKEKNPV